MSLNIGVAEFDRVAGLEKEGAERIRALSLSIFMLANWKGQMGHAPQLYSSCGFSELVEKDTFGRIDRNW